MIGWRGILRSYLVIVGEYAVMDWLCLPWVGDLGVAVYMPSFLDTAQDKTGSDNY